MINETKSIAPAVPRHELGVRLISWLVIAISLAATVACLRHEGRRWWCRCGDIAPWTGGIQSSHTSQHLVDPYSFTHVLHGMLFYALFRLVAGRIRWKIRLALVVGLECVWEIVENSPAVIDRYRQGTIALGYDGDSVLNSIVDIASCIVGFLLAKWLPTRYSIVLFLVVELGLLVLYRDNLLLNLIMLSYPFETIKNWQAGQ